MGKYHINLKGEVAICRAMEHCPLGGAHFDHQTEAIEYADRMNEAVINSKLPEDLARMEYIEADIFRHKFIHDEDYSMQEALKRGEYVEKRVEYARTVEKLDSKSLYYDETIEDYSPERKALHMVHLCISLKLLLVIYCEVLFFLVEFQVLVKLQFYLKWELIFKTMLLFHQMISKNYLLEKMQYLMLKA